MKAILELLRPSPTGEAGGGGRALIYVWALAQKDSRRGWDEGSDQDVMVPWVMRVKKEKEEKKTRSQKRLESADPSIALPKQEGSPPEQQPQDKTFLRYYHLYRKGELEQIVEEAGGQVIEAGYDKDNWWAIAVRKP